MKKIGIAYLALLLASLAACSSASKAGKATDASKLSNKGPVTEADIDLARQAILRAESVEARAYAEQEMTDADALFNDAFAATDDKAKRKALEAVIQKADEAYGKALGPYRQSKTAELDQLQQQLLDANIDLYASNSYAAVSSQIEQTKNLLQSSDVEAAQNSFARVWQNGQTLMGNVKANLDWVELLAQQTRQEVAAAQEAGANTAESENYYSQGMAALGDYSLEDAEALLKDARRSARSAASSASFAARLKETDELMRRSQQEIESAGSLFTVDEDGSLKSPEAWSGTDRVQNNRPAQDIPLPEVPLDDEEDGYLLPYTVDGPLSMAAGRSFAAADTMSSSLYSQAIEFWEKGVEARNNGLLDEANEYFYKALEYIASYKKGAVSKIYEVQYRPNRRDCLWRIAGFKDIYNNIYLWPLLWQSNKKQIPNPDLIYPGQKLLVPPLQD